MLWLFPTEDCGAYVKRAGGMLVVVVVVENARCLVVFENLPTPPIRTPELPLPTLKPFEGVCADPLSPVRILSPVPILIPLSPRVTLLPGRLKANTSNGDVANQRIHAVFMARNFLPDRFNPDTATYRPNDRCN